MATTIVEVQLPDGLTDPKLSVYDLDANTLLSGPNDLTEEVSGFWKADVTENVAGKHRVIVMDGSSRAFSGYIEMANTTETYRATDNYADLDSANQVWNASASDFNAGGTFGKFLRQIKEGVVSVEASVNDASATTTSFITTLTEASDSHYSDLTVAFISGNLVGQSRIVSSYNGTTKTLTFDEGWSEAPADGDDFIILTIHTHSIAQILEAMFTTDSGTNYASAVAGSVVKEIAENATGGGSGFTGARTVTITVDDSTNPVENATVRLTQGAQTEALQTDANGQVTFNLDDATYTVAITKLGYTYGGSSLVVTGDATLTISISEITGASATDAAYGWVRNLKLPKDPDEVLDFIFDWSDELETGETITTSNVTVDSGLTLDSDTNTNTTVTATVSGGTLNSQYRLESEIVTSEGRTYVRSVFVYIEKQ